MSPRRTRRSLALIAGILAAALSTAAWPAAAGAMTSTMPVLRAAVTVSAPRTVSVSGTVKGTAPARFGAASRWRATLEQRSGRAWTVRARARLRGESRAFALRWVVAASASAVTVRVRIVSGSRVLRTGAVRTLRMDVAPGEPVVGPPAPPPAGEPSIPPVPVLPEPTATATAAATATATATASPTATATASPTATATPDPDDPAQVAPPLASGETSSVGDSTAFLYSGADPIQEGVAAGAIKAVRAAVIRGRVLDVAGDPLGGVRVAVLDHPELGHTETRGDGRYDLAANGGALLTVTYARVGRLGAQRQVQVPLQDFVGVDDVRLVAVDARVTKIEPSAAEVQVAQSSVVSDVDGQRRVTMLFDPGTDATMQMPDGTTRELDAIGVRATEFTVGPGGPQAMPGTLPPASAYTYAAEFSVDEAQAAGATRVDFDQPVAVYVDNFLKMPVGTKVPTGYYDRQRGLWVASQDGRVIKLLTSGASPTVDTSGDGIAETPAQLAAIGLDTAELARLAGLYAAGATLWRVQVTHFTPYDCNWPFVPPLDTRFPDLSTLEELPTPEDPIECPGCIISPETQSLGEQLAVTGTPFVLDYRSGRQPGTRPTFPIPLSGPSVPASLLRITLKVEIAGQTMTRTFPATPNLVTSFGWDGKDVYGRAVSGARIATVTVGYVYPVVYATPSLFAFSFGLSGANPLVADREALEYVGYQRWTQPVRESPAPALSAQLGGWTLSEHHAYDPTSRTLYLGNGRQRSQQALGANSISNFAGSGLYGGFSGDGGPATAAAIRSPFGVAVGPDESVYFVDTYNGRVRRVKPDGTITTVAGNGQTGFSGDGGPATAAAFNLPNGVAVGSDGSLYISDTHNYRVRRVGPDGTITTVAGNGQAGLSGDGGPATAAALNVPYGVALGPDGSLYIGDSYNNRVRRVGPDGTISTIAGNGLDKFSGDGGPATAAALSVYGVTVGPDGGVYIADNYNNRVRRVGLDGQITTVAGNGTRGFGGDGGPATAAALVSPSGVAFGPDGSLYIADNYGYRVRRVAPDETITTVAGTGQAGFSGDGGPGPAARLGRVNCLAVGPDGSIYLSDESNYRVQRLSPAWPGFDAAELVVPSEDGSQAYVFNKNGRHLRTVDALTGALIYRFAYDASGRLVSIEDGDGNVTRVERDAEGRPSAIIAPGGQKTTLELSAAGYLQRVVNPAGESASMDYDAGGLLTRFTDATGGVDANQYDSEGRLTKNTAPDGAVQTLSRSASASGATVTLTSSEGRATTYQVERTPLDATKRTMTEPSGAKTVTESAADGTQTVTEPDGTLTVTRSGPDPRFGMLAPIPKSVTVTTPAGRISTTTQTRQATLTDPANPFSLTRQTDTVDRNSKTSTSAFDVATRTLTETSAEGQVSATTLDAKGHVVRVAPGTGLDASTFSYDGRGRLVGTAQGARSESYAYDAGNRLVSTTDASGAQVRLGYDAADRIVSRRKPGGGTLGFAYDALGRLKSERTPGGGEHRMAYTAAGDLANYIAPGAATGTSWSYARDRAPSGTSLAGGETIALGRDVAGRSTSATYPGAATSTSYAGQTSRVAAMTRTPTTGAAEGLTFASDGSLTLSQKLSGTASGTFTYDYDSDRRVKSIALASGTTTATTAITRDKDGRVTSRGAFTYTRGGPARAVSAISDGTLKLDYAYDTLGRLANRTSRAATAAPYGLALSYDARDQITRKVETVAGGSSTLEYTYDEDGQLLRVDRDGSPAERYTYDADGNRLTRQLGTGAVETLSYDAQQRLASGPGGAYTFDANGFMTARGSDRFVYSARGELLTASANGQVVTYAYDALGRRVGRTVAGATTQYLYGDLSDPLRVSAVRGPSGTLTTYEYDPLGHLFAMQRGASRYLISTDQVGTPRAITDSTGATVKRLEFDSYGVPLADSTPGFEIPFGFAGGLADPVTGLVRFGARDYEPATGRWTARDPIGLAGGQTNLYAYVGNSPVSLVDPSGLINIGQARTTIANFRDAMQDAAAVIFVLGGVVAVGGIILASPLLTAAGVVIGLGGALAAGLDRLAARDAKAVDAYERDLEKQGREIIRENGRGGMACPGDQPSDLPYDGGEVDVWLF